MPSVSRLARLARLVTLPETRGAVLAAARSDTFRDLARRAVHDRATLVQDLSNPANVRDLVRSAARHPATRELANAGLLFLPARYVPVGWVVTWATQKALRRYVDPAVEVLDRPIFGAGRPLKNVTPDPREAGPAAEDHE